MLVLDKAASGLKDAPLLWNLKAVFVLIDELGFLRSKHDACLFYWVHEGKLVLVLSLHVDHALATGELWGVIKLQAALEKR